MTRSAAAASSRYMVHMDRSYRSVPLGEGAARHRVVYKDEVETQPGSHDAMRRRAAMLTEFATQPALWACGPILYEKMVHRHDGACWIIELEAEEGRR